MSEVYIGTKFETVFFNSDISKYVEFDRIRFWGKKFAEMGMSPLGGEGNLSFRTENGFIVTATASQISHLQDDDFVEVIQVNTEEKTIRVNGCKEPSSESFMHYSIYQQRPDVNVIFHTHDYVVMDHQFELKFPETAKKQKYGTMDLVKEVLKVSKDHDYFIIKNHGIIALGQSINEAGEKIASAHSTASAIEN